MRILALYDIHGNVDALQAVLDDPRAREPDAVVVGGDVVPGAFAAEALRVLDGLGPPVYWVRGNGEREVAAAAQAGTAPGDVPAQDTAGVTAAVTAQALDAERARALGALPLTVTVDEIMFCHASPRRDDEMLTRISAEERWSAALEHVGARLVVGGHTHQQDDRVVNGVRFINAGSVGLPYEGDTGDARWLWIDDGVPQLRRTAYDHVAAGRRMLDTGYPAGEMTAAALLEPVEAMVVTEMFETGAAASG